MPDLLDLNLPERVRVLSLWSRWAYAVVDGFKTIETRTWDWPYPPGWLAIHAALRWDGAFKPIGGFAPRRAYPFPDIAENRPRGVLCALVWVAGSRPIVPTDERAALVCRPALRAWDLERVHPLAPVAMRGPQKFASVPREVIADALLVHSTPKGKTHALPHDQPPA